jgi:hypothetical protein
VRSSRQPCAMDTGCGRVAAHGRHRRPAATEYGDQIRRDAERAHPMQGDENPDQLATLG